VLEGEPMNDSNLHNDVGKPRGTIATAGAGAVGGASVAAGIFGALGLAKILGNPDYSFAYPLVVFGMVALFILISAIAVAPISQQGARFAWFGVLSFFCLTAAGSIILLIQSYNAPPAYVTATFTPDPTSFADENASTRVQLILQYRTKDGFVPYKDQQIPIKGHDFINLKLVGLDQLETKYNENYRDEANRYKQLKNACKGVHNEACDMVNLPMGTDA
jgi:hypothetical protein